MGSVYSFLVVGDLCLDVDIWPGRRGGQIEIKGFVAAPAGSAGNTAIALKKLRPSTAIALAYPSSGGYVEAFLGEPLKILGLDLIGIRGSGMPCLVVNIMARRGSRRAYTSKGPRVEGAALSSTLDTAADTIHMSGYMLELAPLEELSKLLRRARGRSRVYIDLFPRVSRIGWEDLSSVLSSAHVVLGNRSELQSLGGSLGRAVEKILGLGVEAVVAKMGSAGASLYIEPSKRASCMRRVEKPVTTKGAGDVFNAAFIEAVYRGSPYEEALDVACQAASEHVRGRGPLLEALGDIYRAIYTGDMEDH